MDRFEKFRLCLCGALVGHAAYGLFDRYHEHYWPELIGMLLVALWLQFDKSITPKST